MHLMRRSGVGAHCAPLPPAEGSRSNIRCGYGVVHVRFCGGGHHLDSLGLVGRRAVCMWRGRVRQHGRVFLCLRVGITQDHTAHKGTRGWVGRMVWRCCGFSPAYTKRKETLAPVPHRTLSCGVGGHHHGGATGRSGGNCRWQRPGRIGSAWQSSICTTPRFDGMSGRAAVPTHGP